MTEKYQQTRAKLRESFRQWVDVDGEETRNQLVIDFSRWLLASMRLDESKYDYE